MKPAISVIPITPDERAFISAVLAADAVPHYGRIGSAAAIISATKPGPDGMMQVALEEADRDATFHHMTFHHLELIGVQGFRRAGSISGPSPFPPAAAAPMRDYGVCRLQDRPIDGMIFKGVRTSTKPQALKALFAAPVLDVTRILETFSRITATALCGSIGTICSSSMPFMRDTTSTAPPTLGRRRT